MKNNKSEMKRGKKGKIKIKGGNEGKMKIEGKVKKKIYKGDRYENILESKEWEGRKRG